MTKPSKKKVPEEPRPTEPAQLDQRPPDEASARAKSTAHKKVTADKWNQ